MEIEAKFAVTGPLSADDISQLDIDPYALRSTGEARHTDVLLDTPDRAITSGKNALRVRSQGERVIATFKGPNAGSGGTHEREEIEADVEGVLGGDFSGLPSVVAERVAPLIGDAPLRPLIANDIARSTWAIEREGQVVGELALDTGTISAGGRSTEVHELEVELKGDGTREDIAALAARLPELLPLKPEPHSKLERGLALLDGGKTTQARRMPLAQAGRQYVAKQTRRMRKHEPRARAGTDPEGVHKMRVDVRRLRSALRLLESAPVFSAKELRGYRKGLRNVADALGEVRDLDVQIQRVATYAKAQPDLEADLEMLRQLLLDRKQTAHARLVAQLDGNKFARLMNQLEDFASEENDSHPDGPPVLVRNFAGSAIWRHYEDVQRFDTVIADASPATLHLLRIAGKRLRYAVDLFEKALGKRAEPATELLTRMQDHLGDFHDVVVALDLVEGVARKNPGNQGLLIFASALAAQRDELHRTFPALWSEVSGRDFRERLAGAIARL